MSQPGDRNASIRAPGRLDKDLGEFWVANPFEIIKQAHNLSAYERNRAFLNLGGQDFLDISYLTGADSDGDGRSVVAGDFRNTGQMDLVVRQAGGGALLLFENCFPRRHYLKVTLRGTKSNRQGIGARLIATVAGQPLVRELYPINSFRSQMPNLVHFGLGEATKVERLVVRWPSGTVQELTDLPADRHILVDEDKIGTAAVETITPGRTLSP